MEASATHPSCWPSIKFLVNALSAAFGLTGTWLMSRRYARQPLISVLVAVFWPILSLVGLGQRVSDFVAATVRANKDIEDSVTDMVGGLSFLFWAFLLQAIGLCIDFWHG